VRKRGINIAILCVAVTIALSSLNIFHSLEWKSIDARFVLRGAIRVHPDIYLIELDDSTILNAGEYPLSRNYHADLNTGLGRELGSAKATMFDMLFPDHSEKQVTLNALDVIRKNIAESINTVYTKNGVEQTVDAQRIQSLKDNLDDFIADYDMMFGESIERAGNTYIGYHFDMKPHGALSAKDIIRSPRRIKRLEEILKARTPRMPEDEFGAEVFMALDKLTFSEMEYLGSNPDGKLPPKLAEYFRKRLEKSRKEAGGKCALIRKFSFKPTEDILKIYEEAIWPDPPIDEIAGRAKGVGFVQPTPDLDGVTRRVPLMARFDGRLYPQLSVLVLTDYYGARLKDIGFDKNSVIINNALLPGSHKKTAIRIPVDSEGKILINWAGKWKAPDQFKYFSYYDLWYNAYDYMYYKSNPDDPKAPGMIAKYEKYFERFRNKICLVGATATGTHDQNPIPYEGRYPMVGMHANVINTVLTGNYIRVVPRIWVIILMFALCIGLGFSMTNFRWAGGAPTFIATMLSFLALAFALFNWGSILIDVVSTLFALTATYTIVMGYQFLTEERERKQLKNMFQSYVPPALVESLVEHPDMLKLGGEKKELSVLFSDIAGFTTISEKLEPGALVGFLNEYLTKMTHVILNNNGTLDKYIGDAIMAIFGAPVYFEDHPVRACEAAIEMHRSMEEYRVECQEKNIPLISTRIGINTGEMVAGNLGSDIRFDYTVMGDAVNLASRLEGLNKQYGTELLISEFTYEAVKNKFLCRFIDNVMVVGKEKPVKIYEVRYAMDENIPDEYKRHIELFEIAMTHYYKQEWRNAVIQLRRAKEIEKNSNVCQLYLNRCLEFFQDPPPSDWDGVYVSINK
jgi:adenylate cyclase